jgi:serine/threonine protein phosphatase 1
MACFAVGDIHGCIDQLDELMWKLWYAGLNLKEDTIIFLGDYIDRGPDSKGVIEYMMALQNQYGTERVICLKGNHEDMCLHNYRMYGNHSVRDLGMAWEYNGGDQCIESYKAWAELHEKEPNVMQEHLDWMLGLPTMYENDIGFYVHAGFSPWEDKAEDTIDFDRMWIRWDFIKSSKDFGKTVYFGHTASKGHTLAAEHKIGLDTACVYGYKLTALRINDQHVIQVDGWVKPIELEDKDYE